jgi:hypothetical protein
VSSDNRFSKIVNYILVAISLAMGVAAVVMSLVASLQGTSQPDMTLMLGHGLASLAIYNLDMIEPTD